MTKADVDGTVSYDATALTTAGCSETSPGIPVPLSRIRISTASPAFFVAALRPRDLEHIVGDLMGYIMRDGPGGLTDEPRCRPVRDLGYRRQQPKPEPRSVADPYGLPACNCGLASSSIFAGSRSI